MQKQGRRAGKGSPLLYYLKWILREMIPSAFLQLKRRYLLKGWEKRPDADYIRMRRDFYCQLSEPFLLKEGEFIEQGDVRLGKYHSRYVIDARRFLRCWPASEKLAFCDGDVWENPAVPSLIKARRLDKPNPQNSVILNLDSLRHFLKIEDPVSFSEKQDKLLFRGEIYAKPERIRFFERWFGNELMDLGDTSRRNPSKWIKTPMSIPEHFDYKFILALEGNDMASALQWIMKSNCVAVMPRPKVDGWLMHSQMQPGVHYIEIADDYSDVEDKIKYYIRHPEEAELIARRSKEWVAAMEDSKREELISLLVVEKYLRLRRT